MKRIIGLIVAAIMFLWALALHAPWEVLALIMAVTVWSQRRLLGRLAETNRGRIVVGELERLSTPSTDGDARPTQEFAGTIALTDHALQRFRQRAGLPRLFTLRQTEQLLRTLIAQAGHFETDRPWWAPSGRDAAAWLVIGNHPEGWLLAILDWDEDNPHRPVVVTIEVNDPRHHNTEEKVRTWEAAHANRLIDFPPPTIGLGGPLVPGVFYTALRPAGIARVRAQRRLRISDQRFDAYVADVEAAVSAMRERYPHQVSGRPRYEEALSMTLPVLLIVLLVVLAAIH